MPAYRVPLETICMIPGCRKRATEEVRNTYNERCGHYCKRHAVQRVQEMNAYLERMSTYLERMATARVHKP